MSAMDDYPRLLQFISWAKVRNPDTQFEADVALGEIDMLRNELAALKARRCHECEHYAPAAYDKRGVCVIAEADDGDPVVPDAPFHADGNDGYRSWLKVKPDHACNAWTPKEPA